MEGHRISYNLLIVVVVLLLQKSGGVVPGEFAMKATEKHPVLNKHPPEILDVDDQPGLILNGESTLAVLNSYRKKHGVPALEHDAMLGQSAAKWAKRVHDKVILLGRMVPLYSHPHIEGENVFVTSGVGGNSSGGTAAIQQWYSEVDKYDFKLNQFFFKTAQFTQLVWKRTRRVGMAAVYDPVRNFTVIVARFKPPGNVGFTISFKENIFPPNKDPLPPPTPPMPPLPHPSHQTPPLPHSHQPHPDFMPASVKNLIEQTKGAPPPVPQPLIADPEVDFGFPRKYVDPPPLPLHPPHPHPSKSGHNHHPTTTEEELTIAPPQPTKVEHSGRSLHHTVVHKKDEAIITTTVSPTTTLSPTTVTTTPTPSSSTIVTSTTPITFVNNANIVTHAAPVAMSRIDHPLKHLGTPTPKNGKGGDLSLHDFALIEDNLLYSTNKSDSGNNHHLASWNRNHHLNNNNNNNNSESKKFTGLLSSQRNDEKGLPHMPNKIKVGQGSTEMYFVHSLDESPFAKGPIGAEEVEATKNKREQRILNNNNLQQHGRSITNNKVNKDQNNNEIQTGSGKNSVPHGIGMVKVRNGSSEIYAAHRLDDSPYAKGRLEVQELHQIKKKKSSSKKISSGIGRK